LITSVTLEPAAIIPIALARTAFTTSVTTAATLGSLAVALPLSRPRRNLFLSAVLRLRPTSRIGGRHSHKHFISTGVRRQHFDLNLVPGSPQLLQRQPYSLFYAAGLYVYVSQDYLLVIQLPAVVTNRRPPSIA